MDAIEILKSDHKEIKNILKAIMESKASAANAAIYGPS